jgi:hypothetical protein
LNANKDMRGFNINQMYSFTVSPGKIAMAYLRGHGDEGARSEFHKSKLGQPYIPEGGQILDTEIDACLGRHTTNDDRPIRAGERFITMGVDTGDWVYVWVDEWFFPTFGHDINAIAKAKTVWTGKFNQNVEGGWNTLDKLMEEWQVGHCVIDADPHGLEARRFAQRFPGYVTLCRFRRGVAQKDIQLIEDLNRVMMAHVDRTNWLDCALGRFHERDKIALPLNLTLEVREHLKNIIKSYKADENGNLRAEYENIGPDHFALTRCYSEIALPLAASYVRGQDISAFL